MTDETRIDNVLAVAAKSLRNISDSPALDAELMLCRALNVPRSYLFAHPEDLLDELSVTRFRTSLERRRRGEPMAYIEGRKEFWSLEIMVSPDTLVPRPDTEILVQQALEEIPRDKHFRILDLGTGSGAIALAIAHERPLSRVTATDVSAAALGVAKENARQLDLDNVTFVRGDWLEPVGRQAFDLIVSNPPYVREDDPALEGLKYEPQAALTAGRDGLTAIRVLAAGSARCLAPDGFIMLEHGADQQQDVAAILRKEHWREVRCIRDLAGLPRVTIARRPAIVEDACGDSP